jgi:glycosyltransferase involved in cell wall biosynthesis
VRIAVVVRSLKFGGMERAACNQADAFFQAGHDVDLIYFSNKNKTIAPKEKGVNIYFMDINKIMKKSFSGFLWNLFSKIMNIFLRGTYPLFKGFYTSSIFEKELKKLENGKPYDLILVRGQGSFEQLWRFKDSRVIRISVNVSTKKTSSIKDKIISKAYFENVHLNCNSEGGKYFFERKLKRENVKPLSLKAIRNPFFKEKIISMAKEKNDEIPNEPYILGVGRLVNAKNFELLIDTYIYLKNNFNFDYKLVLVGDGSSRKALKKKVLDSKLQKEVIFAGYQKNPYNWMKNAEMFVLTSKFEGLCGVLIEAMCCQTRIVASKSPGGVKELMSGKNMKENLVEPEANRLAEQVIKVIKQEKEFYFDDYSKMLATLEPSFVVKQWLEYTKREF